ncbi:MAG: NAD(P)H-dependent glycerol-3-phosphate dehydrogenase [Pseudomonadota bacterium]
MNYDKIGVLGAGAWGTALASTAQAAGREVTIWARETAVAIALSDGRGNPIYLNDVAIPPIKATTSLPDLSGNDAILAVVPAQFARAAFEALEPYIKSGTPVVLCAKGIERSTLKLMTDVLAESLPAAIPAVLSGPSFAVDVARNMPTAVTLACPDAKIGTSLVQAIGRATFRPYLSDDLVGAEIGGAVKNVLAIACGISEGLRLGRSAHAALISRGFAEMTRLAVAVGGRPETIAGLSGLGDLVLTCSSAQSRNMSFGKALGEGGIPSEILASRDAVTEGVTTAPALMALARKQNVEMPICAAVDAVLNQRADVNQAMSALLSRPFREE